MNIALGLFATIMAGLFGLCVILWLAGKFLNLVSDAMLGRLYIEAAGSRKKAEMWVQVVAAATVAAKRAQQTAQLRLDETVAALRRANPGSTVEVTVIRDDGESPPDLPPETKLH